MVIFYLFFHPSLLFFFILEFSNQKQKYRTKPLVHTGHQDRVEREREEEVGAGLEKGESKETKRNKKQTKVKGDQKKETKKKEREEKEKKKRKDWD